MNAKCKIHTITVYVRGDDILIDGWVFVDNDRSVRGYKYTWNGDNMYLRGNLASGLINYAGDEIYSHTYEGIIEQYVDPSENPGLTVELFDNFMNDLHREVNQFVFSEVKARYD